MRGMKIKILQGVSFISAPIPAGLSHRKHASAATFRDPRGAQDTDVRQRRERESQRVPLTR
jgi:hypothetical protein